MSSGIRSDSVLFEKIEKSTDNEATEPICCTVTIGQCLPYYGDSCPQVELYPKCKMAPLCPKKKVTAVHSTSCWCCCFRNVNSFYGEGNVNAKEMSMPTISPNSESYTTLRRSSPSLTAYFRACVEVGKSIPDLSQQRSGKGRTFLRLFAVSKF